jgi:type VI protein secretion system component VasK
MGAIFFYAVVYMAGYFFIYVMNLLTIRPLIRNPYMAPLVLVFLVAIAHALMIIDNPPPPGQDITIEYALGLYIIMPVVVVVLGAFYMMWNKKHEQEQEQERKQEQERELNQDEENDEEQETEQNKNEEQDEEEKQKKL